MLACFLVLKKQFFGKVGDVLYVDSLEGEEGKTITFDEVLFVNDDIGKPLLKNAKVDCKILKHGKNKKIRILKMISQKRHRKLTGFRKKYTKLEIISIHHKN